MKLTDARTIIRRQIEDSENEILRHVEKVRRELNAIEKAIEENLRVPSSIGGATHFESTARELARECEARQLRYDFQSTILPEGN